MNNQIYRYNNMSRSLLPSFVNVIKPKRSLTSKLFSGESIKNIDGFISGAQKVISVYDRAMPIINQVKPMIGNIKTTFKVAKAFRKFNNDNNLEKAFDDLPDFDNKQEEVQTNKKDNKVANPFYPWYTLKELRR